MSTRGRIAIGVAALVLLQLLAWLGYRHVEEGRVDASNVALDEETASGPAPGQDVSLARSDGMTITLRDAAAGRPILLHFWASWCVPCVEELPLLLELAESTGDDIAIVLVSVDEGWAPVHRFFDGVVPDSVMLDDSGALRAAYGATPVPQTWLIDRTGELRARVPGPRDWRSASTRERLRRLVGA